MEDQIIEFETAKLAKEKGFDIECRNFWRTPVVRKFEKGEAVYIDREPQLGSDSDSMSYYEVSYKDFYQAPTQSLLQRWLREKYGLSINCIPSFDERKLWWVQVEPLYTLNSNGDFWESKIDEFETFEEALEEGLRHALMII